MLRKVLALIAACGLALTLVSQAPAANKMMFAGGYAPAVYTDFTQIQGIAPPASGTPANWPLPASLYTYSSPSLRTITDATGAITYGPNNLQLQSNNLSAAAWTKNAVTVTPGLLGPYGSNSAYSVITTTANAVHSAWGGVTNTPVGVGNAIIWVIASSAGYNYLAIRTSLYGSWENAWFNLSTGAFVSGTLGIARGSIALPNGYWLLYVVGTPTSANNPNIFEISNTLPSGDGDVSFTGDGVSGVNIYAAGQSEVTYETTPRPGDQVITTSAAYYGPAFDYSFGVNPTPLGLRIWQASTNYALYSRDMTNAAWIKGATMTAALTGTGIDGRANSATTLTGGAVTATNTALQAITLASAADTYTFWIKGVTLTGAINATIDGGATWTALTSSNCWSGGMLNSGVPAAPSVGNWVRCSIAKTAANPTIGIQIANLNDSIIVDGNQLENTGVAGPQIFTAASTVAMAADVVMAQGVLLTALQGPTPTAIFEVAPITGSPGWNFGSVILNHQYLAQNNIGLNWYSSGLTTTGYVYETTNRMGSSWNKTGLAVSSINGGSVSSSMSNDYTGGNPAFTIGGRAGSPNQNGYTRRAAIWNVTLPPAVLQKNTKLTAVLH